MEKEIHISLKPEILFEIAGFSITNSFFVMMLVSVLLILVVGGIARRLQKVPGTPQLFVETFIMAMHDLVAGITQNKKMTKRIFPVFATFVIFFLASNLFGLIPGLGGISFNNMPVFRTPTTDYALIFGLTIVMFITWQVVIVISGGIFGFIKKYLNFSSPVNFTLGLLDIIGELTKIVSLSFRLFGNIFAGEVIAIVMLALAPYVVPVPFAMLGILSSVIQAFVFPILVLIYIKMSVVVREEQEKGQEVVNN